MPICLNNQGVRTPPRRAPGKCVHTFRRGPFVKSRFWRQIFPLDRKDPPARLKTRNSPFRQPLWTGKYIRCAWGTPPYGQPPPQTGKMTPERPFPALIETDNSYPKTGLLPAVRQRFAGGSTTVPTTVSRRFRRRFDDSLPTARPPRSGPVRLRGSTLFRKKLPGNLVHSFKPTNPA